MADQQNNRAKKPTRRTASTAGQRALAKPASSAASSRRSVGGTGSASTKRTRSASSTATARPATTHVQPKSTPKEMVESLLRTSIVARIAVVVIAVLIVVGIGDALANLGKAYPGVS
ncbi:MAG: hypothetical protein J5818_03485, partial [Eggerthellaceae bacterium]|nr:hypothetical protein [Eggerthellaceae bacterium]